MKLTSLFFLSLPPAHSLPRSYPRASVFILGLTLLCTLPARADIAGTVSNDPFDSTRGTVVLNHDVIIDPINAFRTHGGFEDGHTLMRNGGIGSVSFIEFQTGCRASIEGVRLVAANDGAANSFRRSLSRFQLRADVDDNGSFETLVVDTGTVNPDYSTQPGNASANPQVLDLTLTNIGGGVISAQRWRLEAIQGSDVQPFEGARIIEVDALAPRLSVTNTNDSGPGSLRQAILDANTYPCSDTITFDIPGPAPHVIKPLSNLPVVSDPVRIDGTTQPGYAGRPVIELNGALSGDKGLEIQTSNSVVAGLALTLFDTALALSGSQASGNWVYGNHIGLDPTGTNIAANTIGIGFGGGMHHNLIGTDGDGVNDVAERNLISGNTYGFVCYDSYSNRVAGNYIGTDVSGTLARGNSFAGFYIDDSATGNIIGTDSSNDSFNANERNVISGNGGGILLAGPNRVSGNFIGTDPTGAFAVPNAVGLQIGGIGALVGSNGDGVHDDEERNVISGNSLAGMIMGGPSTRDVVIRGNYFGTDASGALAVPNDVGLDIVNHATNSLLRGNLISGNVGRGLGIADGSSGTLLFGNLIGTDVSGTNALGNGEVGVGLYDAVNTTVGGVTPASRNVIAFNGDAGIVISGPQATGNWIIGNYIGLDATGTNTASNGDGIDLDNGAHHNIIGSNGDGADDAGERNVISGNSFGVVLYHCFTNRIAGNFIGTDRSGTLARGNGDGFYIDSSATGNIIGTDGSDDAFNAAERNIISGNNDRGLVLSGPNRVSGNFIGTDVTGTFPVPNQFGVQVTEVGSLVGSDGNGVRDEDERNVISGNSITGVIVRNEGTRDVVIRGNYIGTDVTGQFALPNDFGLTISDQVTNTLVRGNLVSGNSSTGVGICCDAFGTAVEGNRIGTDATGTSPLGNGASGVAILDASDHRIGGTSPGQGNVIAYNGNRGVNVYDEGGFSLRNAILGNAIFGNAGPGIDLGNNGPTPNDGFDGDTGPNALQNFPTDLVVTTLGGGMVIQWHLLSTPSQAYRVEFFATTSDFPGAGQAQRFLGGANVSTPAEGDEFYSVGLPGSLAGDERVMAIATDALGNTSEIGPAAAHGPLLGLGAAVACAGDNAILATFNLGSGVSYRWRKGAMVLAGQTNAEIQFSPVTLGDAGEYCVEMTGNFGAVTNCASLTVFSAADFVVTNTADSGPGTLRSAINVANVCSGTNVIRLEVTGVINLVEELPAVQNTVIVRGPGPALLTIRRSTMPGTPAFRVLTFVADYAELTGVTIANGRANVGAGLYNESDLFISNCVITANTGLSNGCGAGIFDQGSLTLVDSMVTDNTGEGSAFYGAGIEHGFGEGGPGFLHVTRSVIATNYSQGIAGGLFLGGGDVRLTDCTVAGNRANSDGGGVYFGSGDLRLFGTTIAGNGSGGDGGGVYAKNGGLIATNCTISGNTNAGSGGGFHFGSGGGGEGEVAPLPEGIAGFAPADGPASVLALCTITRNSSAGAGGGLNRDAEDDVQLVNTLVAENLSGVLGAGDLASTGGPFVSLGHNLVGIAPGGGGVTNGVHGDRAGTDLVPLLPRLDVLRDNGGFTLTHALLDDSPALNAGTNAGAPLLDQRGAPRIACGVVDIGAVEILAVPPSITCPANIVVGTDAGACVRTNVTFFVPLDLNCADTTVACVPPSGATFAAGVTPVTCVASNVAGTNTCLFTVTVVAQTHATPLALQTVEEGMNAMFCTTASGSGPFSYQWFHEGAPLAGQTNPCLSLIEVSRAAGGEYCVRVSSPCSLTNQCAYLVVTSALAGPRVVSANIVQVPNDGLGQVTVIFSDDMDAVTLTNLSHYRLSGSPVLGVFKPPTFPNAIILQTSMLECGRTYELVLTGLQDGSARFLNPNPTIISLTTTGLAYCAQSYTLDLPAGYSLIANQLNRDQNRLSQVLPEVPPATTVSVVTSNLTLDTYTFGPGGWSGDPVLNPGSGFFIHVDAPTNLTFRGSIPVSVLPLSLAAGPALVSAQKPERSSYTNVVGLPPTEGTLVYQHRPGAPPLPLGPANFVVHMFVDGKWNIAEPVAEVGEAFFVDAFVPIQILTQPVSQLGVAPGASVMFSVLATGTGPLRYQWRRNGVNLPDQTNATLMLPNVQLAEAGDYTVVVVNDFDARTSVPALLRLALPFLPLTNHFANAVLIEDPSGQGTRSNAGATAEPLEPLHAVKPGGKSMWIRWRTSVPGIATFRTTGSSFDTLLGVYRGPALGALETVASDEDSGGFLTSALQFSAMPGDIYHIAVDGLGGEEGDIVLSWNFEETMETLPVIHIPPESQVVAMGAMVAFGVEVSGATSLQWYFRGAPIPGATTAGLVIPSASETNLGVYFVRASNGTRFVDSRAAILQFNVTGMEVQQVFALDKFADAAAATPLQLGGTVPEVGFAPAPPEHRAAPASIVRGYTGTQVFNTTGATTSGGEEPICGAMGGASEWISFVAGEDGVLYLNTDGSSYDTVMAVFKRSVTGALQQTACDNNSGLDHLDSSLSVSVKAGVTNFIVIDGVNSATGNLKLNYSLVTPGSLTLHGFTSQNAQIVRFTGRAGAKFSIQRTTALSTWTTLVTTNAANGVYDYVDLGSTNANARVRFYRAILLP